MGVTSSHLSKLGKSTVVYRYTGLPMRYVTGRPHLQFLRSPALHTYPGTPSSDAMRQSSVGEYVRKHEMTPSMNTIIGIAGTT